MYWSYLLNMWENTCHFGSGLTACEPQETSCGPQGIEAERSIGISGHRNPPATRKGNRAECLIRVAGSQSDPSAICRHLRPVGEILRIARGLSGSSVRPTCDPQERACGPQAESAEDLIRAFLIRFDKYKRGMIGARFGKFIQQPPFCSSPSHVLRTLQRLGLLLRERLKGTPAIVFSPRRTVLVEPLVDKDDARRDGSLSPASNRSRVKV